jgi:hypothetical protein
MTGMAGVAPLDGKSRLNIADTAGWPLTLGETC